MTHNFSISKGYPFRSISLAKDTFVSSTFVKIIKNNILLLKHYHTVCLSSKNLQNSAFIYINNTNICMCDCRLVFLTETCFFPYKHQLKMHN